MSVRINLVYLSIMKKYLFLAALAVFCCGFIQTENEYEKDLKLTINTHKFGVNNDDVINATLHNVSKQDHKIAYTERTGGSDGSILYSLPCLYAIEGG